MHFYPKHTSDKTDSKDRNKKGGMRRNKMGWKEGIEELEPIMTMWVFNIMYL